MINDIRFRRRVPEGIIPIEVQLTDTDFIVKKRHLNIITLVIFETFASVIFYVG